MAIWPIALREEIPLLPIPLLAPDPPVEIDLKTLIEQTYDAGGYADYIYDHPPEPRLSAADQEWATAVIAANPSA